MKISMGVIGDIRQIMEEERAASRRGVTRGMKAAGDGLKAEWRGQVERAGLGSRLARTIRGEVYPLGRESRGAAALVWSRAPQIVSAFEEGALIRAKNRFFLAVPTAEAGARGLGRARVTPAGWQARTGVMLRPVARPNGNILLVADDVRLNTRGLAVMNRRRARKSDGIRVGSMTVPIFILVPQVRLRKRLDLAGAAERWGNRLPGLIIQHWPQT